MLNIGVTKKDVDERQNKMSTKQALSMQATIQNAMINRESGNQKGNPNGPIVNRTTPNGYGRSV